MEFAMHNHHARIDTHRVTLIAQESCATEGLCCNGDCNQGRACPRQPIQSVEDEFPLLWMAYGLVILFTVGLCALLVELS
jgi:hypothetical protein